MRDDNYLKGRLESIWNDFFTDVIKKNNIKIRFRGRWKNKFGHIKKLRNGDSEIAVNGYFRNEIVPGFVLDLTIAHELVHYSHGFNSPLPKMYEYPHKGGVVDRDLKKRGFGEMLKLEKKWIKNEWKSIIEREFKVRKRSVFRLRLF